MKKGQLTSKNKCLQLMDGHYIDHVCKHTVEDTQRESNSDTSWTTGSQEQHMR